MDSIKRRNFLKNAALGSIAGLAAAKTQAVSITPTEVEGPFYPITPQKDKDADLTRVAGKTGVAKGQIIEVSGQVFDDNMDPVEDATIDFWQANSFGKYHHPHDSSSAPIDENFQAWAIIQSRKNGRFKFKTIVPGAYPIGASHQRTPHIHFKIGKLGYVSLLTQMYFPDHPLNLKDGLFNRKSPDEQAMMTAKLISTNALSNSQTSSQAQKNIAQYRYDIILEKV